MKFFENIITNQVPDGSTDNKNGRKSRIYFVKFLKLFEKHGGWSHPTSSSCNGSGIKQTI
jgi:hypothetical protein